MKHLLQLLFLGLFIINTASAQTESKSSTSLDFGEHIFAVPEIGSEKLHDFLSEKINDTQFIMLGEQHGIQEVGELTNLLFNLAHPMGYNTLCIETDELAAEMLENIFKNNENAEKELAALVKKHPLAIPFYDNPNDVALFKNVISKNGVIWGLDQTFIAQFRLNLQYLHDNTTSEELRKTIQPLTEKSVQAYNITMSTEDFSKMFITQYSDELHNRLMQLATTEKEKEILNQFKLTKDIYGYYFNGQYYLNNYTRSMLMKRNFIRYYKDALKQEQLPKVIFKFGANHAYKGLNYTNVLDIANFLHELAIYNGKSSVHVYAMGIDGTEKMTNPFAPESVGTFDNIKDLPTEIIDIAKDSNNKYIVIDATALRPMYHKFPANYRELILKFDILILINDAIALERFD